MHTKVSHDLHSPQSYYGSDAEDTSCRTPVSQEGAQRLLGGGLTLFLIQFWCNIGCSYSTSLLCAGQLRHCAMLNKQIRSYFHLGLRHKYSSIISCYAQTVLEQTTDADGTSLFVYHFSYSLSVWTIASDILLCKITHLTITLLSSSLMSRLFLSIFWYSICLWKLVIVMVVRFTLPASI